MAAAIAFDLALGEYPARLHPVVWMGWLTDRLIDHAPRGGARRQSAYGLLVVLAVAAPVTGAAWLIMWLLRPATEWSYLLAGVLLLKASFSLRALFEEVDAVGQALGASDLDEARTRAGRIVSRDVAALTPPLIASAAIESAAESVTDSFVAPLFYFVLFGPPGAIAYRAVNTLDAMIGYHGRYEYLGKASAHLDDLLNLVPARLAALLLVVSAGLGGGSVAGGWRALRRDRAQTESPNAGWTMSAMAGALGVRLEKSGTYVLGENGAEPEPWHIRRALLINGGAALLFLVIAVLVLYLRS